MKLLKNRAVAIIVLIAAIALSSLYGLSKRPAVAIPEGGAALNTNLSTAYVDKYIVDEARALSGSARNTINLYNANWDQLTGSILAVVSVRNAGGDIEDAAWAWADQLQLGEDDAILLLDTGAQDYRLIASGRFYDRLAAQSSSFVDACLVEYVQKGDYSGGVVNLLGQLHLLIAPAYTGDTFFSGGLAVFGVITAVVPIVVLLVVLIVLFNLIDGIRYSSWYGRYGTMMAPPVIYRPILWWHRPGSRWFRRRRNPPPPPPRGPGGGFGGGPRPPMGGGPRPPMGGGPRPPMGGGRPPMGGGPTPPRSGSFGGGSRGGGFGSGSSGSFGGGSRGGSFGGGRSGGFGGGSRGGGFGGGSRGGGFGGGSRGGGFGGRR